MKELEIIFNKVLERNEDILAPLVNDLYTNKTPCSLIAIEELGELIQAVTKRDRLDYKLHTVNPDDVTKEYLEGLKAKLEQNKDNMAEEIADVLVVLSWIVRAYAVDYDRVCEWLDFKASRIKRNTDDGEFR